MLQKRVGAPLRDQHKAVARFEKCGPLKSLQKSVNGLHAVLVGCADGETRASPGQRAFARRPSGRSQTTRKSSVFHPRRSVWKLTSRDRRVDQDGRDGAHEELHQPIGAHMVLEGRAGAARRGRAGNPASRRIAAGVAHRRIRIGTLHHHAKEPVVSRGSLLHGAWHASIAPDHVVVVEPGEAAASPRSGQPGRRPIAASRPVLVEPTRLPFADQVQ